MEVDIPLAFSEIGFSIHFLSARSTKQGKNVNNGESSAEKNLTGKKNAIKSTN